MSPPKTNPAFKKRRRVKIREGQRNPNIASLIGNEEDYEREGKGDFPKMMFFKRTVAPTMDQRYRSGLALGGIKSKPRRRPYEGSCK